MPFTGKGAGVIASGHAWEGQSHDADTQGDPFWLLAKVVHPGYVKPLADALLELGYRRQRIF